MLKGLSRDQIIGIIALAVAVAAIIVGVSTPEIRQRIGLEKPPETHAATAQSPPQTENTEPPKTTPKTTAQKTTNKVTGDNDVVGNNTNGNHDVTGNNNQTRTAIAPNGIAISGGNVQNPTVNNYSAPPPRRLSDEQRRILIPCLQTKPGSFTVSAIMNSAEAHRYAQDYSEVFTASGWKNEKKDPVQAIFVPGGWTGVHFKFAGTWDEAARRASMHPESPEWNALICLGKAGIVKGVQGGVFDDIPTGIIRIEVAENPQ